MRWAVRNYPLNSENWHKSRNKGTSEIIEPMSTTINLILTIANCIIWFIVGYSFGFRKGRKASYDAGYAEGGKNYLIDTSDIFESICRRTELTAISAIVEIRSEYGFTAEMRLSQLKDAKITLSHALAKQMVEGGIIEPRIVDVKEDSQFSETVTIGASALIAPGIEWLNRSSLSEVISNLEQSVNIKYEPPRIIGKISSSPGCRRNV